MSKGGNNFIDLTGRRFGRLLATERGKDHISKSGKTTTVTWKCLCDCGNEITVQGLNLRNGHVTSCGCYRKEFSSKKIDDLRGRRFGRLLVLERSENVFYPSGKPQTTWKCQCDCGNEIVVGAQLLKSGKTKSCGCIVNTQAGLSHTRQYTIWKQMISRCQNVHDQAFSDYGSRGIEVCKEWLGEYGFQNFYKWSIKNGYADNLTIDRINVNGNYEPSNCRWATMKEQQNNRRNNRFLDLNGEKHTIAQWSEITRINAGTIRSRLKLGWSIEDTLTKKTNRRQGGKQA